MRHDVRMVVNLYTNVENRRQGHAQELMNRVMKEADGKKMILLLTPDPYDDVGPDAARLIEWYASMGFNEIQHEPLLMARMFNIPQVVDAAERVTNLIVESTR